MRTVALIVYPDKRIFTIGEYREPQKPMHSGVTDEENESMRAYGERRKQYMEAVKNADLCLYPVAREILDAQYPNWEQDIADKAEFTHYDVKNIVERELLHGRRTFFDLRTDTEILCVDAKPLPGNEQYPNLEEGKTYPLLGMTLDGEGNQHLNVGIVSTLNYVSSYETGAHLPNGDKIHWCHPTRFTKVLQK